MLYYTLAVKYGAESWTMYEREWSMVQAGEKFLRSIMRKDRRRNEDLRTILSGDEVWETSRRQKKTATRDVGRRYSGEPTETEKNVWDPQYYQKRKNTRRASQS